VTTMNTQPLDLGRYGARRFAVVASAGFDAAVAHRLATWRDRGDRLRRVSRFTYARLITRNAMTYGYPMMQVDADGQTLAGALVMVFNLPQYGFGLRLCPAARGDDGLLDWLVFERPGRLTLARYWAALLRDRHLDLPDVQHGRARRITITADTPVPLEVDGEAAGHIPITLTVEPAAMRIITARKA